MKINKHIKSLTKALVTTLALTLNIVGIYKNQVTNTNIFQIELLPVCILVFLFYYLYEKNSLKKDKGNIIFSLILSFFMVFGYSYLKINSWNLIFGNIEMFILSVFSYFGYFFLIQTGLKILEEWFSKLEFSSIKGKKKTLFRKFLHALEEHPIRTSFIVLIAFWLIYMIAFYPIILSPDPSFQIKMYFNEHTKYIDWVIPRNEAVNMTTHHPVIHTLLLGGGIQLGRLLGSDNLGLFFYSMFQTVVLALTLSYTVYYTKKLKLPNVVRLILLGIYALVPMFPLYAMSGVKDTFYTCFVILYTIFLLDLFLFQKNKKINWWTTFETIFLLLMLALFRNNGVYVIILSFPILFFIKSLDRTKLGVILVSFLALYLGFNKILIPMAGISEGSVREILSLPFQQTARYVKEHEEDITKEEKKIIDKILGYEDLKDRYKPTIADPVKNEFNKNTTKKDLQDYFKVWLNGLLKHPDTYIQATMNNVYGYFYPNSTRWYVYYKFDDRITQNDLVDYHYNKLSPLRTVLSDYGVVFPYIPVLGFISNIGFNTWVLFFLVYETIRKKKKILLPILVPSLVTLLICVASPVNCYFRYAMPYIFMMPFLLLVFQYILKKENKNYEREK